MRDLQRRKSVHFILKSGLYRGTCGTMGGRAASLAPEPFFMGKDTDELKFRWVIYSQACFP